MTELEVRWGDQAVTVDPSRSYVIGRSTEADIRVTDPVVSRHHADLDFDGRHWKVADRSSAGTYVDGVPVDVHVVDDATVIRLGADGAPELALRPLVVHAPPAIPVIDELSDAGTIGVDDQTLRLDLGHQSDTFTPGTRVVVGRDAECQLTSDNRLVSREHCAFHHDGRRWILEDLSSTRGTYVDGNRVTSPTPVQGAFVVGLGDPSAGEPLRVVTAGEHKPPADRRPLLLGAAALVVVIVAALAAFVLWPDPDDGGANSASELAAAKEATVLVWGTNSDGSGASGSGAFVAPDLVLTNRHVAEGWEFLDLAIAEAEDEPVQFRYRGEVAAIHPYLDVALVRIVGGTELLADGTFVDARLPDTVPMPLPLGDSTSLRVGSGINAFGFPIITSTISASDAGGLTLPVTTVSEGEIVSFQLWPGCANPDADALLVPGGSSECAPDGDLAKGNMVTSDLSGSGGSGGPVVVGGEIVGIRYAVSEGAAAGAVATAGVALSIPVEFFADWMLDQAAGS